MADAGVDAAVVPDAGLVEEALIERRLTDLDQEVATIDLARSANGYGLTWIAIERHPVDPPVSRLYFMRLAPDGAPLESPVLVTERGASPAEYSYLAMPRTGIVWADGRYAVAWIETAPFETTVAVQSFGDDGARVGETLRYDADGPNGVLLAAAGESIALTMVIDFRPRLVIIDRDGAATEPRLFAEIGDFAESIVAMIWDGEALAMFVRQATRDPTFLVRFHRASLDGAVIGTPRVLAAPAIATDAVDPIAIMHESGEYALSWILPNADDPRRVDVVLSRFDGEGEAVGAPIAIAPSTGWITSAIAAQPMTTRAYGAAWMSSGHSGGYSATPMFARIEAGSVGPHCFLQDAPVTPDFRVWPLALAYDPSRDRVAVAWADARDDPYTSVSMGRVRTQVYTRVFLSEMCPTAP